MFFPPKSWTKAACIWTFGFLCELCCFLGGQEKVLPSTIHSTQLGDMLCIIFVSNVYFKIHNCMARRSRYRISLIWQVLFRHWYNVICLISINARSQPHPFNMTQWRCYYIVLKHPYPQAYCTIPSFACINNQHLWSYGKIGDCEQPVYHSPILTRVVWHRWAVKHLFCWLLPNWINPISTHNPGEFYHS